MKNKKDKQYIGGVMPEEIAIKNTNKAREYQRAKLDVALANKANELGMKEAEISSERQALTDMMAKLTGMIAAAQGSAMSPGGLPGQVPENAPPPLPMPPSGEGLPLPPMGGGSAPPGLGGGVPPQGMGGGGDIASLLGM